MSKNFSLNAISAVSGKPKHIITERAVRLGIRTGRKGYTIEQAHALIYYNYKRPARTESVEQEASRLLSALQEMNIRKGKTTVIAA